MKEASVGSIVITENEIMPVGIFSEQDYVRRVILKGRFYYL
jgi:hypothetical protein